MLLYIFLSACLAIASGFSSLYHKNTDIEKTLISLQNTCENDYKLETILDDPLVHLVSITKKKGFTNLEGKKKVFYLFGEHPRELISPETGLNLVKTLCSSSTYSRVNIEKLLEKNIFHIVVNANPNGRNLVEQGQACQRTNIHGVDLNRNWDDHWSADSKFGSDSYPGLKAFSERETIALKDAVMKFKPDIFATIHSGTLGMYTPFAYQAAEPAKHEDVMLRVLNKLNTKYCDCDVGAAGDKVGYLCPGTCLDYAYDKVQVPYSFAFEIYSANQNVPAMRAYNSLLQVHTNAYLRKRSEAQVSFRRSDKQEKLKEVGSCFIQSSAEVATELSDDECFFYFNPTNDLSYSAIVDNWTDALLELPTEIENSMISDFLESATNSIVTYSKIGR